MGLGSTAKKIQGLSDRAEAMYKQVQQLQQRITNLEGEVDDTHDTVERIDHQLSEQRQLLLAIAEEQGIDGEQILAEAAIDEAELDEEPAADETDGDGDATTEPAETTQGE
ncbi:DUF5798 family protein [Natrialba asiatica]|uniref:Uncharacterized protein n=1 Tax=Natrialba asiatica (strain ATCC 700177 / DSM 12278 / JCM 9576 / FERM P-10747 / NBRC 102637 / 172P1) TaxID=29540 RepID=M0AP05_NATA1|nr:DUF5798 family protein [Natrialba asiatica]ELZ00456.1 hypothetical protein C481_12439 [Natrialba asiatica DSM 12278]